MLTNHGGEFPYRTTELYNNLGLTPTKYLSWVKRNLITSFKPAIDYISLDMMSSEKTRGNFRQEFAITKRTAEELALLSRTEKGKILRNWLLDLKDKVEANELLTLEQVYFLIDLVNVFSFVVNQKSIEETHKLTFINDYIDKNGKVSIQRICQEFHIMRNKALDISPETLKERVLRFYDEENQLVNKKTKREILSVIDKYALIGNAAFDFMASINKPEKANFVGEMVKGMAKRMNVEIRQKNEADLFNEEKDLNFKILSVVNNENAKLKKEIDSKLLA